MRCLKVLKNVQIFILLEAKGITKLESYTNQKNTEIMSDIDTGTYIRTHLVWELTKININNY